MSNSLYELGFLKKISKKRMKKSSSFVIFNISKQNKYEEYKEKNYRLIVTELMKFWIMVDMMKYIWLQ